MPENAMRLRRGRDFQVVGVSNGGRKLRIYGSVPAEVGDHLVLHETGGSSKVPGHDAHYHVDRITRRDDAGKWEWEAEVSMAHDRRAHGG